MNADESVPVPRPLHVLLVASDAGRALAPLDERHDLALLPLAGKTVLEHVIESIVRLAPDHVTVAASRDVRGVRRLVRDGTRWGVPMNTISVRLDEPATDIVRRERSLAREDLLVVEADRIVATPLAELLDALRARAVEDVTSAPRALLETRTALRWYPRGADRSSVRETSPLAAEVHRIDSAAAFHALSLAAARGEIATLRLRGRRRVPGLVTGFASRLRPASRVSGTAFAGARCRVHASCRLSGTVVLNHGVAIDRGTDLHDAVVLDDTYLGEGLSVRDAIVAGDTIVRVDTGAVLRLTDRFLAADLDRSIYEEHFGDLSHRLAGAFLLSLSLPLWPLAAILSRLDRRDGGFVRRERRVGNGGVFTTFRFGGGPARLRRLPMLLAVVAGHLRLIGVTPLTPEECEPREDGWERARDGAPIGLVGPTQLHLGLDAPLEQRLFSDAVFARSGRGLGGSAALLAGALRRVVAPRPRGGDQPWMDDLISG